MTRRAVRIAIGAVVLAVAAKLATFLFVVSATYRGCGDAEDRFRVLQVTEGGGGSIVGVDYRNAESSARVLAFWIVLGKAPLVGSEDRVCGNPAAVWIGDRSLLAAGWNGTQPVLLPKVRPARVVASPYMTACYFGSGLADAGASGTMLCYDASRVSIGLPSE